MNQTTRKSEEFSQNNKTFKSVLIMLQAGDFKIITSLTPIRNSAVVILSIELNKRNKTIQRGN